MSFEMDLNEISLLRILHQRKDETQGTERSTLLIWTAPVYVSTSAETSQLIGGRMQVSPLKENRTNISVLEGDCLRSALLAKLLAEFI